MTLHLKRINGFGNGNGGGGGGDQKGEYLVKVIDYDGTVIDEQWLNDGDEYTLPSAPDNTSKGLLFQEWSCSKPIVNNKVTMSKTDLIIGAIYTTVSGLTEVDIEVTVRSGKQVTCKLSALSQGGYATIDWGDGTITDTGMTYHTYSDYGTYTIKTNGDVIVNSTAQSGLFGQGWSFSHPNGRIKAVRFAKLEVIKEYALEYLPSLEYITLPKELTTIEQYAFDNCTHLKCIIIPNNVTTIGQGALRRCYSLKYLSLPKSLNSIGQDVFSDDRLLESISLPTTTNITEIPSGFVTNTSNLRVFELPNSITTIKSNAFYYSGVKKVSFNSSLSTIEDSAFSNCLQLEGIDLENTSVTSIGGSAFNTCRSVQSIKFPSVSIITNIGDSAFSYSCFTEIKNFERTQVTSINCFYNCKCFTKIKLPNTITTIGSSCFQECPSAVEYDFSDFTQIPTLSSYNAFQQINSICKIKVPASLYEDWIAASNWSSSDIKNCIVAV